jgi:flagellar biosynthesis/type III secretory pathway M-ring protein FliF/YscJ
MFVDRSIGDPLKRKQLKWLLLALGAIMIIVILFLSFRLMKEPASVSTQSASSDKGAAQAKPTQEEIQKQLEALAAEDAANPAPKPTQEEIQKQLEALAAEDAANPAPKPTQEEIRKQLEMLSKQ